MNSFRSFRGLTILTFVGAVSISANANANTWTGLAAPDANWTTSGNWDTGVPISGNTASFVDAGNGNTTISLGGVPQPIGGLLFDTANVAPYTLGTTTGDALNLDPSGTIIVNTGVPTLQTIGAAVTSSGGITISDSATAPGGITFNGNVTATGLTISPVSGATTFNATVNVSGSTSISANTGASSITFNGQITGSGSLASSIIGGGTLTLNGANTYSGGTTFNSTASQPFINIGSSSVGSFGSIVSGPLGTGNVHPNSANPPIFVPIGADRTIANDWTMDRGIFMQTASTAVDNTGPHNLILTGPVTYPGNGRVTTSNSATGSALIFGDPNSPSTYKLGNSPTTFQRGSGQTSGGWIVFNDQLQDFNATTASAITVQNGVTVVLNHDNIYSGTNTLQTVNTLPTLVVNNPGPGSGTGTGKLVVTNGTLAGTGRIAPNPATLGTNTALVTLTGGKLQPGPVNISSQVSGIGTLTFDSGPSSFPMLVINPFAQISMDLNNSFQSDKVALINGAAGDITFSGNAINFTDLSGGSLYTGQYTLFSSDVPNAYTGISTDGNGNITDGLSIGTGLEAYSASSLQVVGNNIVLNLTGTTPPALLGDFNNDGKVDAGDYATWRKNQTANAPLPNDNGLTTQAARFSLWRANFGNSLGAGSGLKSATVPEPVTWLLIVLGAAAAVATRHQKHFVPPRVRSSSKP